MFVHVVGVSEAIHTKRALTARTSPGTLGTVPTRRGAASTVAAAEARDARLDVALASSAEVVESAGGDVAAEAREARLGAALPDSLSSAKVGGVG